MRFNLHSTFRLAAGVKSFEIDQPEPIPLRVAAGWLLDALPALRPLWLTETGEIGAHAHFFINRRDARSLDKGMQALVNPQDAIDCFAAVSGGSGSD